MESLSKRSRLDNGGHGSNYRNTDQQDLNYFQRINGGGDLECRRFNTPEGCSYGKSCRFRHVSAGDCIGDWSSTSAFPVAGAKSYGFRGCSRDVGQLSMASGANPKPCMKFFSTSGCPFGESCHFLHYVPEGLSSLGLTPVVSLSAASAISQRKPVQPIGNPSVTVSGYKTKLCNRFNTPEGCRFDDRSHFAHGESDLQLSNNFSRGSNGKYVAERPSGVGPSGFESPDLSNSTSYGNDSNLDCQGYSEPNPPGVAGDNGPSELSIRTSW